MTATPTNTKLEYRINALESLARSEFAGELPDADLEKLRPFIRDLARMIATLRTLDLGDADPRSMCYEADNLPRPLVRRDAT